MAIQRWDPLRDLARLQERVNALFDETLSRSAGAGGAEALGAHGFKPPMDLFEEEGRFVLRVDLPGIEAADVDVQVDDGHLVLRGERRPDPAVPRESYLRVERPHGRFALQVSLPPSIDSSAIRATHRNGVLEVLLPKARRERAAGRVPVGSE